MAHADEPHMQCDLDSSMWRERTIRSIEGLVEVHRSGRGHAPNIGGSYPGICRGFPGF